MQSSTPQSESKSSLMESLTSLLNTGRYADYMSTASLIAASLLGGIAMILITSDWHGSMLRKLARSTVGLIVAEATVVTIAITGSFISRMRERARETLALLTAVCLESQPPAETAARHGMTMTFSTGKMLSPSSRKTMQSELELIYKQSLDELTELNFAEWYEKVKNGY